MQCDTVVICAGQEPRRELHDKLRAAVAAAVSSTSTTTTATPAATAAPAGSQGSDAAARPKAVKPPRLFLIGGAYEAGELDAKRAIDQGTRYYYRMYIKCILYIPFFILYIYLL